MTLGEQIMKTDSIYLIAKSPNDSVFSIKVSQDQVIKSIPFGFLMEQTDKLREEKTLLADFHNDPAEVGKKRLLIQINDF